jgi:acetylornithine deacetylase/succinyl-diaminopimelate desuccinylase-like protein
LPDSKSNPAHRDEITPVLLHIDNGIEASLQRLTEFLQIPSIGTDPAHAADCTRAAEWLCKVFEDVGIASNIRDTTGRPVVVAQYRSPAAEGTVLPHVLFYGHYDVQPSVPDEKWTSPPFKPQVRMAHNGRRAVFARGAADDKGQLMTFVEACRRWLEIHGQLPFHITFLIEGDEEGDCSHLDRFVAQNADELTADMALICDTNLWDASTPCITTSLRGCIAEEVVIRGPKRDLHSGYYGGPAANPIKVLARIIGSMHDTDGRVAIPEFYRNVRDPSADDKRKLKAVTFNQRAYFAGAGLTTSAGEKGYSVLEQLWFRPTAEVNGMIGGYTQPGEKTVLPAQASAKFTFRLVEGQSAKHIRKAFRAFVTSGLPDDCTATFDGSGGESSGVRLDEDNAWVRAGAAALEDEWEKPAVFAGDGASVPIVETFKRELGLNSLMIGFGLEDDCVHSPDEKYDIRSFHKGMRSWTRLISYVSANPSGFCSQSRYTVSAPQHAKLRGTPHSDHIKRKRGTMPL